MKKIEIDTFLKFQFVSNPSFSPDGKYIAFVVSNADRAENTYKANLYVYDMAEKKVRKMTSGGDAKSYVWTKRQYPSLPGCKMQRGEEETRKPEKPSQASMRSPPKAERPARLYGARKDHRL